LDGELYNPELPVMEFRESLSRISNRMPKPLADSINQELQDYQGNSNKEFPGNEI
jgi:hypothetical protein